MTKVVAIHGVTLDGEADPGVVEELERLLDLARSGELRGFAYATAQAQDVSGTGWAGANGSRHMLSSAIMMLSYRYAEALTQ
jgi:hypothetical protein